MSRVQKWFFCGAFFSGKKVKSGNMCLYCNQTFHDVIATQRHMDSKGHAKMGYEGEFLLEYEDFYDFTRANEEESAASSGDVEDLDGNGYEMTLPSGA